MRIGTKSVLFGVHAFWLHPWIVALAWWKLYGFPWDPRLWLAFFVHDLGYWGKPNMDGDEGERHPEWGAWVMGALFAKRWHDFTLYHSRFYAKNAGAQPSRLCIADKLAITLTPLYLPMARLTGEIREYMKLSESRNEEDPGKYVGMGLSTASEKRWHSDMCAYISRWVDEHKDGREDKWTPDTRQAETESGVWS